MSFQSFITQQVAALTERLNAIASNAKKIIELPWQSVLRPESEIHVSDGGTSFKIKIQQIFDWFYSIRQNQVLSANISVLVNEVKVASGAQWIIGNVNYSTISDTSFTIEYAEDGYTRNDILVADKNNHIVRVIGPETVGISPTPPTPIDTVLVTIINITDATIGNTPPIIGGDYEKVINKQNSLAVDGSGTKYPTVDAVNAGLAAIVVPDATTVVKGIVKLAGDLGGTADAPTTPTALHRTGNESWTGQKSAANSNAVGNANLLQINNNYSTNPNGKSFALTSGSTSNSVLMGVSLQSPLGGKGIEIVSTVNSTIKPISLVNNATEVLSIDKLGNITTTGNVISATPTAGNHLVTKAYADNLVVGLLNLRGSYNASTNLYPSTGGSGVSGAIQKGDLWFVSVPGTLSGRVVNNGDSFVALSDAPGQTFTNWNVMESNIGYVPADDSNVLHKTGNETFSGIKTVTSANGSVNGLTVVNNATLVGGGGGSLAVLNTNTDAGVKVENTGLGIGLYSNNNTNGNGSAIVADNNSPSGTGFNYEGRNSTVRTFSVNRLGDVVGNKFTKTGGLATEYLKADGSVSTLTNPITGTGASGQISYFNGVSSQAGNANFIWDNTNGRLGLGTPSPTSKLHLVVPNSDGISVESSNSGLIEIRKTGGARWRFQNDLNSVNGLELLYGNNITPTQSMIMFQNDGNVGIGTTTPTKKLEVNGTIRANTVLMAGRDNVVGDKFIILESSTDGKTPSINSYLAGTGVTDIAIQRDGGNVGIGTTNPAVKLDVRGKFIVANDDFVLGSIGSLLQIDQGATSGNTYSRIGAYNIGGTNPTNLVLSADGGNVLIGTTTGNGSTLNVAGTVSATGYKILVVDVADTAFNNTPVSSQRTTASSSIDIGFGTGETILESFVFSTSDYGMQRITYTNVALQNRIFIRSKAGGTWSAWVEK